MKVDMVNDPPHYKLAEGIECIDVVSMLPFELGNAIKYRWRCDFKGNKREDLEKSLWYLKRYREHDPQTLMTEDLKTKVEKIQAEDPHLASFIRHSLKGQLEEAIGMLEDMIW